MSALDRVFRGEVPIAVIAPHPDDESLGCGALLARAFAGAGAHVICLTDGSASHPGSRLWPPADLARLRQRELQRALACLGGTARDLTWLGLPDAGLYRCDHDALAARLERIIADLGITHIFAPAIQDHHEDHQAAARATAALRHKRLDWTFFSYPVWSRWDDPDFPATIAPFAPVRLPPGPAAARKRAAIEAHESQLGRIVTDDPTGFVLPPAMVDTFAREDELFWRMPA